MLVGWRAGSRKDGGDCVDFEDWRSRRMLGRKSVDVDIVGAGGWQWCVDEA